MGVVAESEKEARLDEKREHILEQIDSLKHQKDKIVGKMHAPLLEKDDEIRFQEWRIAVIEELKAKNSSEIRLEIKKMRRKGQVFTAKDRSLIALMKYAIGEVG